MSRRSGYGWLELIIGVVLIFLGLFTFANPGRTLTGLMIACGVMAVVMGIGDIILYVRIDRYTGFGPMVSLISGILSVMSGIMLLVYPDGGVWVLSMLFPIWFIAHCISRLSHLNTIRLLAGKGMYYFTMILNVAGLVLGFLMAVHPMISVMSIGYIGGLYLILQGIDSIAIGLSRMGDKR